MTSKEKGALISKAVKTAMDKINNPLKGYRKYSVVYSPNISENLKNLIKEYIPIYGDTYAEAIYEIERIKRITLRDIKDFCKDKDLEDKELFEEINELYDNSKIWDYQYIEF